MHLQKDHRKAFIIYFSFILVVMLVVVPLFTSALNALEERTVQSSRETLTYGLQQLEDEYVPVNVSSDEVEYLVNMTDDSVIVTVFNNNGITNKNNEVEQMDPDKVMTVTVEYTGIGTVSQVNDWFTGETLEANAKQTLVIGPGDLAIIEFVL